MADTPKAEPEIVDELRLALATCGAITLVVYESGVCHELERLIAQTRQDAFQPTPTQKIDPLIWRRVFAERRIRPVIDVLTGASAGGINSVFLGSCLVSGRDFSPFRRLWVDGLDAAAMRHPGGDTPRALLYTQRLFDEAEGHLRTNAGAASRLRSRVRPPLTLAERTIVETKLDLRLCLTDFKGYTVSTADALGHRLDTETKTHVEGFTEEHLASPALIGDAAKAARATSAFPGLFDPVPIRGRWFVDGGLWNNQPIDQALNAIRDRPAYGRTHRVVMFIEPNPSRLNGLSGPTPPAPTLIENVSIIPGIGMKGSILPALEGLLDVNRRIDYYETLTSGISGLAEQLGAQELDYARRELEGLNVGQKGITLLNKIRIENTLLDHDPRRIQAFRSLLAQLAVLDRVGGQGYEQQVLGAMLDRLKRLEELDLQQRTARRKIKNLNESLKQRQVVDAPALKAEKQGLYRDLGNVSKALETALGGRERPFESTGFGKRFDAFAEAAIDWLQSFGGVNQGLAGLSEVDYPKNFIVAVNAGKDLFPDISKPTQSFPDLEPNGEDAWRHVLAGISDLEAKHRIDLVRISPNDVDNHHLIGEQIGDHETAAQVKLASDGLGHIQGLLEARWRRNDYVWGRLDAAEILLRTLQRYGTELGHPMTETEFQNILIELQNSILDEEAAAFPEMRDKPVGAFPSDKPDGVRIAANRRLIGYGREKIPDADEPRFASKLHDLIEAAQKSLNGSPKIAVSGLSFFNRFARILAFLLGLTRPIWPKPYRFGSRLMGLGVILALIVVAYYLGLRQIVPSFAPFDVSSPTPKTLTLDLNGPTVVKLGLGTLALVCLGAGLGIDLWIALPVLFVAGYLIGSGQGIDKLPLWRKWTLGAVVGWTLLKRTTRPVDTFARKVKAGAQNAIVPGILKAKRGIAAPFVNAYFKIKARFLRK